MLDDNEVKFTFACPLGIRRRDTAAAETLNLTALIILVLPDTLSESKAKDVVHELTHVLRK